MEIQRFQDWAQCPDPHGTTERTTVARHPDGNFTDRRGDPNYDELQVLLWPLNARTAEVDARAGRLGDIRKHVRLDFGTKWKWQETTLDRGPVRT